MLCQRKRCLSSRGSVLLSHLYGEPGTTATTLLLYARLGLEVVQFCVSNLEVYCATAATLALCYTCTLYDIQIAQCELDLHEDPIVSYQANVLIMCNLCMRVV